MIIYKVSLYTDDIVSCGFHFTSSLKKAKAYVKCQGETFIPESTIEKLNVAPTKSGILRGLNRHAGHNDNG